jgi:hypothetical protein
VKMTAFVVFLAFSSIAFSQEKTETRELVGHIAKRSALLVLHATQRNDGGWQITGEYLLLPNLVRRYLDGDRSPELGVTTLKEGTTAILFGRPAIGELRGTWRAGVFRGTRYGPGGQERESFEFSEEFPAMDGYSAAVRCDAGEGRYSSALSYSAEGGALKSFEWRASAGGHVCAIANAQQQPVKGGLRVATGECSVTLREIGDFVKVSAENCTRQCGSEAYFEPLLVDRRGNCRLLRGAQ